MYTWRSKYQHFILFNLINNNNNRRYVIFYLVYENVRLFNGIYVSSCRTFALCHRFRFGRDIKSKEATISYMFEFHVDRKT